MAADMARTGDVAAGVLPCWRHCLLFWTFPALEMFTQTISRSVAVVPLWYALFCSIRHAALLGTGVVLLFWLISTYFLWVAGMSIHQLFRRSTQPKTR